MIGNDCLPVCNTTDRFIPNPNKITAYCKIFLDVKVMPDCNSFLSLINKVMIIPRIIPKTGPPTIGNFFPKNQQGIAITKIITFLYNSF